MTIFGWGALKAEAMYWMRQSLFWIIALVLSKADGPGPLNQYDKMPLFVVNSLFFIISG